MNDKKLNKPEMIQWHIGFCAAMQLELSQYKAQLSFNREYNINKKPLQMDLLIIKKSKDVLIDNEIGRIFRGHNIMEYKSAEDDLNLDVYMKVVGYACIYKAQETHVNEIMPEDITLTFIREGYPRKLFEWFRDKNFVVEERYHGIYYISKEGYFATQIIVMKELSKENHTYLISLTSRMDKNDVLRLTKSIMGLTDKEDMDNAEALLQISMMANKRMYYSKKEVRDRMNDVFRRYFQNELERAGTTAKGDTIIEILEDCGEVSQSLKEIIHEQTDTAVLKQWTKLAARVESIDVFEKAIGLVK